MLLLFVHLGTVFKRLLDSFSYEKFIKIGETIIAISMPSFRNMYSNDAKIKDSINGNI